MFLVLRQFYILAHIQGTGKLKLIVKSPCLYHFWLQRSSPDKLSTKIKNGCHLGCWIENMTAHIFMGIGLPIIGKVCCRGNLVTSRHSDQNSNVTKWRTQPGSVVFMWSYKYLITSVFVNFSRIFMRYRYDMTVS